MTKVMQIEEIATMLCGEHKFKCSECNAHGFCVQESIAIRLYDMGYRKQIEGEDDNDSETRYYPNRGAKMDGGKDHA